MAEWSIRIGGSSGFVISKDTVYGRRFSFLPQISANPRQDQTIESVDYALEIRGCIISDSSGVATGLSALIDLIQDQTSPVQIEILRDGSEWRTINTLDCLSGPYVMDVRTVDEPGAGESHWTYDLTIRARVRGDGAGGVEDLKTELILYTSKAGEPVRKIWRARAKARTHQQALSFVLGFKPSGVVEEMLGVAKQDREAFAEWVWEREKEGTISHRCNVQVTHGTGFVSSPQADGNPNVHEKLRDATRIEIQGEIISSEAGVAAPPPHFTESDDLVRDRHSERNMPKAEIHDEEKGHYRLAYNEVWLSTAEVTPEPNHSEHDELGGAIDPGDGAIA